MAREKHDYAIDVEYGPAHNYSRVTDGRPFSDAQTALKYARRTYKQASRITVRRPGSDTPLASWEAR